jgi:hypothetical protein
VARAHASGAHRPRDHSSQRPALRGSGRFLPPRARPEAQVQLCVLRPGRPRPVDGGGRDARAHDPAGEARRRAAHPRARVRLGELDVLHGPEVSALGDRGGLELGIPARVDRGACSACRHRQRSRDHGGRERVRARGTLRPARLGRDVRARPQLGGVAPEGADLAGCGRTRFPALLRAPDLCLPLRVDRRRRLDGPPFLHGRHDAGEGSTRSTRHPVHDGGALGGERRTLRAQSQEEAARRVQRWRIFLLSCAELFGFDGGNEWLVSHVLLAPSDAEGGR